MTSQREQVSVAQESKDPSARKDIERKAEDLRWARGKIDALMRGGIYPGLREDSRSFDNNVGALCQRLESEVVSAEQSLADEERAKREADPSFSGLRASDWQIKKRDAERLLETIDMVLANYSTNEAAGLSLATLRSKLNDAYGEKYKELNQ